MTDQRCGTCGELIDSETCWCGNGKEGHPYDLSHQFVSIGCTCGTEGGMSDGIEELDFRRQSLATPQEPLSNETFAATDPRDLSEYAIWPVSSEGNDREICGSNNKERG